MNIAFEAPLWEYDEGGWHFVTVPLELSEEVREVTGSVQRGFGSLRVRATIGGTTWTTSVFPSKNGSYLLPVKKPVRKAEGLDAEDMAQVELELLDLV